MLKKRIIPCLDIKDGRTVKGVNFINITDAGDPLQLAQQYAQMGADELVFLDISAGTENRGTLIHLVQEISKHINIPFTVGGGINTLEQAKMVIKAGADKVSINSAAVANPALISEIAAEFGSQCVVLAIDTNIDENKWKVYVNGGRKNTNIDTLEWAQQGEYLGAGEILLTAMTSDGTKNGFACDITKQVCGTVNIPVIASGGAGSMQHFADVFLHTKASAALAASVFHFSEIAIPDLKAYLKNCNIPIR